MRTSPRLNCSTHMEARPRTQVPRKRRWEETTELPTPSKSSLRSTRKQMAHSAQPPAPHPRRNARINQNAGKSAQHFLATHRTFPTEVQLRASVTLRRSHPRKLGFSKALVETGSKMTAQARLIDSTQQSSRQHPGWSAACEGHTNHKVVQSVSDASSLSSLHILWVEYLALFGAFSTKHVPRTFAMFYWVTANLQN